MANRRLQNKEIERKKRQNRNTAKAIGVVFAALLVIVMAWVVWDIQNRRVVITFNDTRIPTSEFQFFLDMMGRTPEAREAALIEFIGTLATLERAAELGVSISEESRNDLQEMITQEREFGDANVFRGISDDRLIEIFSVQWMMLHPLMAEAEFPDHVLDINEDEIMENFLQALGDEFISDYDIQVYVIAHYDIDYLNEILPTAQAVESPDEFIALVQQHCMWQSEFEEIILTSIDDLYFSFDFDEETRNMLLALEPGGVSQVVRADDQSSMIIYIASKEALDTDELFENFRANAIDELRFEAFFEQVHIWIEDARERMDINHRAVDRA